MCEQQPKQALNNLWEQLITIYTLQQQIKNLSRVEKQERACIREQQKKLVVNAVAEAYCRAQQALTKLGMPGNEKRFLELKKKDVVPFVVLMDDKQLGDGKKVPSWVWSNFMIL